MPASNRGGAGTAQCVWARAPRYPLESRPERRSAQIPLASAYRGGFTLLRIRDKPAPVEISCVYCGTVHLRAKETKTSRISIGVRPLSVELGRSKEGWSQKIECPTCSKKYDYIETHDSDYFKNRTRLTKPVIEGLKMLGIDQKDLESVLGQDLKIAMYKRSRKTYFDISFGASGQKLYIHCRKTKDNGEEIFLALNIGGGRLG